MFKAGFHVIADRRKFCDRLRSYGNRLLRLSAIMIAEDRTMFYLLRSCDHMETKVLRSAIETYPIIFLILTDDSTLPSHKARKFVCSNAHLF